MKSVITCDMEGRILTMNDDAEKIFGYKKRELIGKKRGQSRTNPGVSPYLRAVLFFSFCMFSPTR